MQLRHRRTDDEESDDACVNVRAWGTVLKERRKKAGVGVCVCSCVSGGSCPRISAADSSCTFLPLHLQRPKKRERVVFIVPLGNEDQKNEGDFEMDRL